MKTCFAGFSANASMCPELGESSSIFEDNLAWACELQSWKASMVEWKDLVERECSTSEENWQSLYECPDYGNVTCRYEHAVQHNYDVFSCHIVACTDGRYSNQKAIRRIWRKHLNAYKKIFEFYQTELRFCNPRDCSEFDASTEEPSTTTAMSNEEESSQTTATTSETTPGISTPDSTTEAMNEMTLPDLHYGDVKSRDDCTAQQEACFWVYYNETAVGFNYHSAVEMCDESSSVVAVIPDSTTFDDILSNILTQTVSSTATGLVWLGHTYNTTVGFRMGI